MNNDKTKDFINAMGAMAEIAGVLRDNLMANGFTRKEAVEMATEVMIATITEAKSGPKD